MKYWNILLAILFSYGLSAQEFNAKLQVLTEGIQATNKQRFETLEKALVQFINNRKWTERSFKSEERIECSFVVNITNVSPNNDQFDATLQIQYSRPIFNSGYRSSVFVHRDNKFNFRYLEFDRLDFQENRFTSNLTSVLAYYVYIILGLDADTYELNGGDPYYAKAQTILGNAQNSGFAGWGSFDGRKNRFWLVDNLTSPVFDDYRACLYNYHRKGLDLMYDPQKHKQAKENIKNALLKLENVNDQRPNSFVMQLWFDAKNNEIADIFSGGEPVKTAKLKEMLVKLDANNTQLYNKMSR